MRELPLGWAWATLDDFADHCLGKMLDKGKKRPGQFLPYLRNINVRWGRFELHELLEMPFESDEFERYGIRDGDLLVCEGGEPARSAVWRSGTTELKFQKALHRLRCRDGIVPEYIAFQLQRIAAGPSLEHFFTGTTIKHLTGVSLRRVPFKIAPTAEQVRIVAKIQELFDEIEAGEQELEKAREGLAAYRRAVLKAAVTGHLTRDWREKNKPNETGADLLARILAGRKTELEGRKAQPASLHLSNLPPLPPGWVWATVDQICPVMQYGTSAKCSTDAAGVPVLRMGNIQDGQLDFQNLKFLPAEHPEFPDLLLEPGDILFNRTNSPELVGKSAVYMGGASRCSFASYLIRLRLAHVRPEFAVYFLNSAFGRRWIASVRSQQVGQANVSGGKLKGMPIPIPPRAEQDEIVRRVEGAFEIAQGTEGEAGMGNSSSVLRQCILSAAFSGTLVSQDPTDEPASLLLDRLKASRMVEETNSKGRSAKGKPRSPLVARRRGRKSAETAEGSAV